MCHRRWFERRSIAVLLIANLASAAAHGACTVTTTGISFGGYDVFSRTDLRSSGTVVISCNDVPPADVTLSLGASLSSGRIQPRWLRAATGTDHLDYNLFIDASLTRVWGDGLSGGQTIFVRNVHRNRPEVVRFYGRIPAGQDVGIGVYADSVTITFTP